MVRNTIAAASLLLIPTTMACSGASTEPQRSASTSAGLTIETHTADRVAGRFTKGAATVAFELRYDGTDRHVSVTTADGAPLVDSTIHRDGGHTTALLGGRLVVEDSGGTPKYTGDRGAEKALHEMPESEPMEALEPALAEAKVEPELLPTVHRDETSIHPTDFNTYHPCGSWVPPGDSAQCGTWFLGWTSLKFLNCTPGKGAMFYFNDYDYEGIGGAAPDGTCAVDDHSGWWFGRAPIMMNTSCFTGYPSTCTWIYYGH